MDPPNRINRFVRPPPPSSPTPYNGETANVIYYTPAEGIVQQTVYPPVQHSPPIPIPHANQEEGDFGGFPYNEPRSNGLYGLGRRSSISRPSSPQSLFQWSSEGSNEDRDDPNQQNAQSAQDPFRYTPPLPTRTNLRAQGTTRCPNCGREMLARELRDHICQGEQHTRNVNALTTTSSVNGVSASSAHSGVHRQLQEHGMAPIRPSLRRFSHHFPTQTTLNGQVGSSTSRTRTANVPTGRDQAPYRRRRSGTVVQNGPNPSQSSNDTQTQNHLP